MFGISFAEIAVVLLICFLVVGPKKMTQMAYQLGIWLGQIKEQLKILKETQMDSMKDSVFYEPNVEMNKKLDELDGKPTPES